MDIGIILKQMNMQQVKSIDVKKIIDLFKKVLPMAIIENHLNMSQAYVNYGSDSMPCECGTIHCHGGWFAIAASLHLNNYVSYLDGAEEMASILGLKNYSGLVYWARANPSIWGNDDGFGMFCCQYAFYNPEKRRNGAENLQHIVDHWQEVHDRLVILENKVEISEPPITTNELIEELESKNILQSINF